MKFSKNVARGLAVSAMMVGLVALPALPASAQLVSKVCPSPGYGYVHGSSNTTWGQTVEDGSCGRVAVRVRSAHPGGVTWKVWVWHASGAVQYATNIDIVEHKATYKSVFSSNPYLN